MRAKIKSLLVSLVMVRKGRALLALPLEVVIEAVGFLPTWDRTSVESSACDLP